MDPLSSLQINSCDAHEVQLGTAWRNSSYQDDINRLYLVESGSQWIRINGRQYTIIPGKFLLIPAGSVFDFGCPRQCGQHYIHFRASAFGGIPLFDLLPFHHELSDPGAQEARLRLHRVAEDLTHESNLSSAMMLHGILLQLLCGFIDDDATKSSPISHANRFRPILGYIEMHLDRAISVPELAMEMHLDRTHFTRSFTQTFGVSPARYVLGRRIARAQQLLLDHPQDTLERIADQTGFADAFHFSRAFNRITGKPPSAYRKQMRP